MKKKRNIIINFFKKIIEYFLDIDKFMYCIFMLFIGIPVLLTLLYIILYIIYSYIIKIIELFNF